MLYVFRGLPASGKSRDAANWAARITDVVVLSRDAIRASLFGAVGKTVLPWEQEKKVTEVQEDLARFHLKAGKIVIIDDLNLRPKYVRRWLDVARMEGVEPRVLEFNDVSLGELIERDSARSNGVGEEVIRNLTRKYTRGGKLLPVDMTVMPTPPPVQPYQPSRFKPTAYIVDLDGTVAEMGSRDPFDMTRVGEDFPKPDVIRVIKALAENDTIIFMSGRDTSAKTDTIDWITDHMGMPNDFYLYMRAEGDYRPDQIIKAELFDKHVRNSDYAVRGVFDDRQRVVDMWREMGLTVFQVAPGDF